MSRTRYRTEADESKHRQEMSAKEKRHVYFTLDDYKDTVARFSMFFPRLRLEHLFLMLIRFLCVLLLCLFAVSITYYVNLGLHLIIFI